MVFTDHKDGSEKDSIKISTSGDTCRIILDNEERKISIADKDSGCSVEMNYSDGEMKMAAGKKMTLLVGDSVSITMNGETGTVVVEADKVQIKAGRSYEFTTDGTAKLSGQQVSCFWDSFSFHRELRSYEIKNAPRGSHCGGTETAAHAPAAGGKSCKAGFFLNLLQNIEISTKLSVNLFTKFLRKCNCIHLKTIHFDKCSANLR